MARCTVERLMADLGLSGAVRGKVKTTTIPDPAGRGHRTWCGAQFASTGAQSPLGGRPDLRLDVVGLGVRRVRHRRLRPADPGLAGSDHDDHQMVLDSIEQAIWTRQREGIFDLKDVVAPYGSRIAIQSIRFTERLPKQASNPRSGRSELV